jgi:hypothetical protein
LTTYLGVAREVIDALVETGKHDILLLSRSVRIPHYSYHIRDTIKVEAVRRIENRGKA